MTLTPETLSPYQVAQGIVTDLLLREINTLTSLNGEAGSATRLSGMGDIFGYPPIETFSIDPGYASSLEVMNDAVSGEILHFITSTALDWTARLGDTEAINEVANIITSTVRGIKNSDILPQAYREHLTTDDCSDVVAITIYMITVAFREIAERIMEIKRVNKTTEHSN